MTVKLYRLTVAKIGGIIIMAAMKMKTYVEYNGKQVEEKELIANIKKVWVENGNKVGDIKTLDLYIKPEESAVYYVINEKENGSIEF